MSSQDTNRKGVFNTLKNLPKAVPPRTRGIITWTAIIAIGAGIISFKTIFNSTEAFEQTVAGDASIQRMRNVQNTPFDPTADIGVRADTAVGRELQEAKEREINRALESGSETFIDTIKLTRGDGSGGDGSNDPDSLSGAGKNGLFGENGTDGDGWVNSADGEGSSGGRDGRGGTFIEQIASDLDPEAEYRRRMAELEAANRDAMNRDRLAMLEEQRRRLLEAEEARLAAERRRLYQQQRAAEDALMQRELMAISAEAAETVRALASEMDAIVSMDKPTVLIAYDVDQGDGAAPRPSRASSRSAYELSPDNDYFERMAGPTDPLDLSELEVLRSQILGVGRTASQAQAQAASYPSDRIAAEYRESEGTKISIGDFYYGVIYNETNSDRPGYFWARILSEGPLKNAILRGDEPQLVGEDGLKLTFNKLSLNGEDYDISAVAVDPDTWDSVMADNVDRHILERYSKLFFATALRGYVDYAAGSTTRINSDGTVISNRDPMPGTKNQLLAGGAAVGDALLPFWEKDFERPPTVKVFGNRNIGIVFDQGFELKPSSR